MRITVYSTHAFDRSFLNQANETANHDLQYIETLLDKNTVNLAAGSTGVCLFVNDKCSSSVLTELSKLGVRLVALRSAGFNHVDLKTADELGITVLRVPAYSPYAVAEHAIALILALNRKVHRAYNRVREQNFSLDGLLGFDLHGRTCGVIGTGEIGKIVAEILLGFGCQVIANDIVPNPTLQAKGVKYVTLDELYRDSEIISLHCPLTPETRHLIDKTALNKMKRGVMLINTSRGALVDSKAVIVALKKQHLGYLGLDVYEEEGDIFFRDLSDVTLNDDVFVRLMTFPNVLITSHQAFFTSEALTNISKVTIKNISDFEQGKKNRKINLSP